MGAFPDRVNPMRPPRAIPMAAAASVPSTGPEPTALPRELVAELLQITFGYPPPSTPAEQAVTAAARRFSLSGGGWSTGSTTCGPVR
jgi:hypothetical protein